MVSLAGLAVIRFPATVARLRICGAPTCQAAQTCPTGAITPQAGIDPLLCVNCGTCVRECPGGAFSGNLGELPMGTTKVPITLRQSDRARALRLCTHLKDLILDRKFSLTGKVEDLL